MDVSTNGYNQPDFSIYPHNKARKTDTFQAVQIAEAQSKAAKVAGTLGGQTAKSAFALTPTKAVPNTQPVANDLINSSHEWLQKSQQANTLFLTQQKGQVVEETSSTNPTLANTQGKKAFDIDEYFTPKSEEINLDQIPLLIPSAENIGALSAHVSDKMRELLKANSIERAPDKIIYDHNGQMQLPPDYPYAEEFKQALADNPAMAQELQTISALTSHHVGMQAAMKGENNATTYAEIALSFSNTGTLSVTADGRPYDGSDRVKADISDAEQAFLDYMNMTPEERLFIAMLKEEGLTKEEFDALPPEEQAEIAEKVQIKMKERIENIVENPQIQTV